MNEDEKHEVRMGIGQKTMGLAEFLTDDDTIVATRELQTAVCNVVDMLLAHGIDDDVAPGLVAGIVITTTIGHIRD